MIDSTKAHHKGSNELTEVGVMSSAAVPEITIIMNCWNGEAFIKEALDSVIAQTFGDWTLILFDDRSTDSSAEIFNSYNEPRFHYVMAEQQLDLTAAREEAIKFARSEWIAFLDQDDVWFPDKLELQLQLLKTPGSDKVGLIYGRAKRFGYIDSGTDFDHHFEGVLLPELEIFDKLSEVANFIPMSSAMIRRTAYENMIPVPKNVRLCPDYYYWMAISRQWQVRAVQDTCCLYRVRGNDFSSSNGVQIFTEFFNVLEYFSNELDPLFWKKRRRTCQNLIGTSEMASGKLSQGIIRIMRHGSLLHLLRRTPSYIFRWLKYLLPIQNYK